MGRESAIEFFLKERSLARCELTDILSNQIYAVRQASAAVSRAAVAGVSANPESAAGALADIFARTIEILEGSIVAEHSGLGPASEALSRSGLEYCAKVAYILAGDPEERYTQYMRAFAATVEKGLQNWSSECADMAEPDKAANLAAIAEMQDANDKRWSFLGDRGSGTHTFPTNIRELFRQAGLGLEYRTLYWRLSSNVHGDAEDTFNCAMMLTLRQMGQISAADVMCAEVVVFSWWYAHMVMQVFLNTCQSFHVKYVGIICEEVQCAQRLIDADTQTLAKWMKSPSPVWPLIGTIAGVS